MKFRIWVHAQKGWKNRKGHFVYQKDYGPLIRYRGGSGGLVFPIDGAIDEYDKFTVQRYTEVKDFEGNEIYEGDLLETKKGFKLMVYYQEGSFMCMSDNWAWGASLAPVVVDSYKLKVVGHVNEVEVTKGTG